MTLCLAVCSWQRPPSLQFSPKCLTILKCSCVANDAAQCKSIQRKCRDAIVTLDVPHNGMLALCLFAAVAAVVVAMVVAVVAAVVVSVVLWVLLYVYLTNVLLYMSRAMHTRKYTEYSYPFN